VGDGEVGAAHERVQGGRVEGVDQELHVLGQLAWEKGRGEDGSGEVEYGGQGILRHALAELLRGGKGRAHEEMEGRGKGPEVWTLWACSSGERSRWRS
jgi:hypothetical protein